MVEENDHSACVNAWMARGARELPPARLTQAFEDAFAAMWRRAHQTLGDVTLTAIVDRALYVAVEQYPSFESLKVDATGLRCEELRQRAHSMHGDQLVEGVRFILVEFLTVLGNLTDEILTSALHGELSKVVPDSEGLAEKGLAGESRKPESKDGEGAQS